MKCKLFQQKANSQEKTSRMHVLRVVGLPIDLKDAEQAFIDIVKEKMNVELKSSNDTNADITIHEETPRVIRPNKNQ